jgi:hypothetical protein
MHLRVRFSSDFGDLACLPSNIVQEMSSIEQNRKMWAAMVSLPPLRDWKDRFLMISTVWVV